MRERAEIRQVAVIHRDTVLAPRGATLPHANTKSDTPFDLAEHLQEALSRESHPYTAGGSVSCEQTRWRIPDVGTSSEEDTGTGAQGYDRTTAILHVAHPSSNTFLV